MTDKPTEGLEPKKSKAAKEALASSVEPTPTPSPSPGGDGKKSTKEEKKGEKEETFFDRLKKSAQKAPDPGEEVKDLASAGTQFMKEFAEKLKKKEKKEEEPEKKKKKQRGKREDKQQEQTLEEKTQQQEALKAKGDELAARSSAMAQATNEANAAEKAQADAAKAAETTVMTEEANPMHTEAALDEAMSNAPTPEPTPEVESDVLAEEVNPMHTEEALDQVFGPTQTPDDPFAGFDTPKPIPEDSAEAEIQSQAEAADVDLMEFEPLDQEINDMDSSQDAGTSSSFDSFDASDAPGLEADTFAAFDMQEMDSPDVDLAETQIGQMLSEDGGYGDVSADMNMPAAEIPSVGAGADLVSGIGNLAP